MKENQNLPDLNTEQKKAVSQIEGPVMVIAGPGTGKTQILASRIAQILKETDSSIHNILCLTYTDAGTIAMRKRLIEMIGNDGHRAAIHTFHGFCNRVIQENQEFFDYKDLEPITDLEKIELISGLATNLDNDHPLKKMKGNISYLVSSLSNLFDWMKKENVSISELEKSITTRKTEMIEGDEFRYKRKYKEFQKGDLKTAKIEEENKKLDDLFEAANLFFEYQNLLKEKGRYDYADMILWVIDLFKKSSDTLADYQETFHYILIDEFQDTSGSQNDIIRLLINYWDSPNVFVVGDDDQSIYRFQGAEVKNILEFSAEYQQNLKSIVLTDNYRSTQRILNVAQALISENKERLVNYNTTLTKDLKAAKRGLGSNVKVLELDSSYSEAIWISEEIKRLIQSGESPHEIAVIYRNHAHGDLLAQMLAHEQIPVYLKKPSDVLQSDSVRQLNAFLRYAEKEIRFPFSAEFELYEMLHFPCFELNSLTLARLSFYLNKHRSEIRHWREFISGIKAFSNLPSAISKEEIKKILNVSSKIEDLIAYAATHSPLMIVNKVVRELKLQQNALSLNEFSFELESIVTYVNYVESESKKNPSLTLSDLNNKNQLMEKHRLSIPKENIVFDNKGVNLLTAHASKGLEFKTVFVINCVEKAWEKMRSRGMPFGLQRVVAKTDDQANVEELRRLFYVALTRAEENLYLTYFTSDAGNKEHSRSLFLDEVLVSNDADLLQPNLKPELTAEKLSKVFTQESTHSIDLLDPPFLDEYLQNYRLSVSHLNSYIECPTTFYFRNILRVPSFKNVYMSFGIAVHNTLDQIFKIRDINKDDFNVKKVRELFSYYLKLEQAVFTQKEFEDFNTLGREILSSYFEDKANYWQSLSKIETEVTIDRVEINGVPIKGQLDKIEFFDNAVNVVDYKTGDALNGIKKLNPPAENAEASDSISKRFGGPYWRQILFYSLLINHDASRKYKMISGQMEFVEPSEKGEFLNKKVIISPEAESQIISQVEMVYGKIKSKQFKEGCMKPDCHWCNFTAKYLSKRLKT